MSHDDTAETLIDRPKVDLGKYGMGAALLGVIAVGGLAIFGMTAQGVAAQQVMGAYLYGLIFWTAITLGMFGLTILHHATRATWTLSVLRILEAGGSWLTLLILGLCFIPVFAKLSVIYPWADTVAVAHDKVLQHKAMYLNPGAFIARWFVYFIIWIAFSWFLRDSVMRQEKTLNFKLENARMSWGAAGIVMFFLTATFAFIDWIMSLEPRWYSTMYGLWFTIGSSLGAYALAVTFFNLNADKAPYSDVVSKPVLKDQANMLFVHTMLWGYTSLSQFLIIWNGNLPETTQFFARRSSMGWNAFGMATVLGQFFIPFFVLMSPRTKKVSATLRSIAGWMFFVHIIDFTLIIAPALPGRDGTYAGLTFFDVVSFVGFGALWMAGFSRMSRAAAPFPAYDRRLQEAQAHAH